MFIAYNEKPLPVKHSAEEMVVGFALFSEFFSFVQRGIDGAAQAFLGLSKCRSEIKTACVPDDHQVDVA